MTSKYPPQSGYALSPWPGTRLEYQTNLSLSSSPFLISATVFEITDVWKFLLSYKNSPDPVPSLLPHLQAFNSPLPPPLPNLPLKWTCWKTSLRIVTEECKNFPNWPGKLNFLYLRHCHLALGNKPGLAQPIYSSLSHDNLYIKPSGWVWLALLLNLSDSKLLLTHDARGRWNLHLELTNTLSSREFFGTFSFHTTDYCGPHLL